MSNSPPFEQDPGGTGNLAIAALLSLFFGLYLVIPATEHVRAVQHMIAHGVQVEGVTRICTRARGRAKVVLVDFFTAEGKEWTCGGQLKAQCDTPKQKRFVVYDPSNPARCMIGPMALMRGMATGVLGPLAGAFGFFVSFMLCAVIWWRRRKMGAQTKPKLAG
jgi:hypothetical protein